MLEMQTPKMLTPEELLLAQQLPAAPAPIPVPVAQTPTGPQAVPSLVTTTVTPGDRESETKSYTVASPEAKKALETFGTAADTATKARADQLAAKVQIEDFEKNAAEQEAQARQEQADAMKLAEEDRKRRLAELDAEDRRVREEIAASGQNQDEGLVRKFLSALSLAAGTYATAWGVHNTALDIYRADQEKKENAIKLKYKKLEAIPAMRKDAREAFEADEKARLNQAVVTIDTIKAKANALAKSVPQVAARVQEENAKLDMEQAKAMASLAEINNTKVSKEKASQEQTVSVQDTSQKAEGMGGRMMPGARDIEAAATAEVMESKATKLDKLTKEGFAPTPDEIAKVHNNELQFLARQHQESASTWQNLVGQLGRGVNIFPDSIYPKEMRQETREWIRNQRDLWHSEAVALYGLGWLSTPENYAHVAEARAPKIGDTQQDILEKAETTSKQAHIQNKLFHDASKPWRQEDAAEARRQVAAPATQPARGAPSSLKGKSLAPRAFTVKVDMLGMNDDQKKQVRKAIGTIADPKTPPDVAARAQRYIDEVNAEQAAKRNAR